MSEPVSDPPRNRTGTCRRRGARAGRGNGFVPTILLIGLFVWFMRRAAGAATSAGGMLGAIGRSKARRHEANEQRTTFADVAGIDEATEELAEVVDFLKNPDRYRRLPPRPRRRPAPRLDRDLAYRVRPGRQHPQQRVAGLVVGGAPALLRGEHDPPSCAEHDPLQPGSFGPASQRTLELIDEEVRSIIDDCYQHAIATLTEHREQLDALASALLEYETLDELDAYAAAGIPAARGYRAPGEQRPGDRAQVPGRGSPA